MRNALVGAVFFTATAAAAQQVPFRDMPLEERVCPDVTQTVDLGEGRAITKESGQFCYAEPHADSAMLFPRTDVRVFYGEERTNKKDDWSGPNGYTKIARQLLVTYDMDGANYEIWFITSPQADGKGLYDREGRELLYLTKTEDKKRMKNDFSWYHGTIYTGVESIEENAWKDNGILMKVERLMNHLRGKAYRAAKRLKPYIITFEPAREKKESPLILKDTELWEIAEETERIYSRAKYKTE